MKRYFKRFVKRLPGYEAMDHYLRRRYATEPPSRLAPPASPDSPLPSLDEVRERAAELFRTDAVFGEDLDLRETEQLELLREIAVLAADFDWPEHATPNHRYHSYNAFFHEPDGLILFGILRRFEPKRIIEVGSGFSSALMLETNERFLAGAVRMTFIDPDPARLMGLLREADRGCVEIVAKPVQQVPPELFATLGANDLLFIDSSHVGKIGSDVLHVLFQVLPRLGSGCIVHFHDVFWPFEYPRVWVEQGRAWNEDYFVRAFLQYNSAFEILFFNNFIQERHAEEARRLLPRFLTYGSSSLWLRKR